MGWGRRRGRGGKTGYKRGQQSVKIVSQALEQLQSEAKIIDFTLQDLAGIDVVIRRIDGSELPIEVKSSYPQSKKHRRRYRHVPCITVASENFTPGEPEDKLVAIIKERLKKILSK